MSIYEITKHFHSGWAYLVLGLTVILFVTSLIYFFGKKPIDNTLRKISFFTILSFHIQFLVGIILYIVSPVIQSFWENGFDMSDSYQRLLIMEHPIMMFTAVILMTIGNAKLKRKNFINFGVLIFFILGILCFYMIPWTQWIG